MASVVGPLALPAIGALWGPLRRPSPRPAIGAVPPRDGAESKRRLPDTRERRVAAGCRGDPAAGLFYRARRQRGSAGCRAPTAPCWRTVRSFVPPPSALANAPLAASIRCPSTAWGRSSIG